MVRTVEEGVVDLLTEQDVEVRCVGRENVAQAATTLGGGAEYSGRVGTGHERCASS